MRRRFCEVFLDRVERASGSDPLEFFQNKSRELLQHRSREGTRQALRRLYDEVDERFGTGTRQVSLIIPGLTLSEKAPRRIQT